MNDKQLVKFLKRNGETLFSIADQERNIGYTAVYGRYDGDTRAIVELKLVRYSRHENHPIIQGFHRVYAFGLGSRDYLKKDFKDPISKLDELKVLEKLRFSIKEVSDILKGMDSKVNDAIHRRNEYVPMPGRLVLY